MAWRPPLPGRRSQLWRTLRVGMLLANTIRVIYRERHRVVRAQEQGDRDARPDMDALGHMLSDFKAAAVELGGLLIKLGQFLSARADLLPPEALAELGTLQDEVPPEPFDDIRAVIEAELGNSLEHIFASIDPMPSGSASLGQVHRATLADGRVVAVKVQRPGAKEAVRNDLRTLHFVLGLMRQISPGADALLDIRGLYREFSRMVYEELDYEHEAHNIERFAEALREESDVVVPEVIRTHSTHRVLTLQWIHGIKLSNVERLDAAGVDRVALVRRLASLYFKQVIEVGFFHADPHPGNIFVLPAEHGVRIAFIDFGMVGVITPRVKAGLRTCFTGVVQRDSATIVRGLDAIGFLGEHANHEAMERAIDDLMGRYGSMPLAQMRELNPTDIIADLGAAVYDQPVRLPAQLAFLGRAASMLAGLCAMLSPEFNLTSVAGPFAEQFMHGGALTGVLALLGVDSLEALGRDLLRESVSVFRSISSLPKSLERVLEHAERGELRLVIESATLTPAIKTHAGRRLAVGMLRRPVPAWVPVGMLGAFVATWMLRRRSGSGE